MQWCQMEISKVRYNHLQLYINDKNLKLVSLTR